jgi:hypothetical protein
MPDIDIDYAKFHSNELFVNRGVVGGPLPDNSLALGRQRPQPQVRRARLYSNHRKLR